MKKLTLVLVSAMALAACGKQKKLVIMSKGPAEVDMNAHTITAKDGGSHEEKEVMVSGDHINFKLVSPAGEAGVQVSGDGLFIVNVKNDTIIGAYQKYSDPKLAQNIVSQEELKRRIDSLQLLSENKNVSEANRNFYLLPNTITRITGNTDAMIVGPYHRMRSAERVDGKDPEVYRFYSIKEVRETLAQWRSLTIAPKQ